MKPLYIEAFLINSKPGPEDYWGRITQENWERLGEEVQATARAAFPTALVQPPERIRKYNGPMPNTKAGPFPDLLNKIVRVSVKE